MARLSLTLAAGNVDRVRPIVDGRVQPEGIDLNYIPLDAEEAFWRMTQFEDFDASEMSGTAYMIERSRPNPRFVAIPVFTSRAFRHDAIYVHAASGITRPEDLRGRTVGLPEYNLTACVWMRGMLRHEYNVLPTEIHWRVGGQEQPGRKERAEVTLPAELDVQPIPGGETLNGMLERGEIDALMAPRIPRPFAEGSPHVRRLFEDPWSVEEDYYQRTNIFPIMHLIVLRQEFYTAHPWAAQSLYKAFVQAKAICQREMYDATSLRVALPWILREIERDRAAMGTHDVWPYGLEASRPTLEAMVQYHVEQGLIPEAHRLESLFAPATLDEFRI
jgi:4,5-dihydroxyphthalate decarboxylase